MSTQTAIVKTQSKRDTMSLRALNRALLERQMLLSRKALSATEAIEQLLGLQAQNTEPPYYALWARLEDFQQGELDRLLLEREVVRLALMRSTIHLVTARDCLTLRPLMQPVLERGLYIGSPFGKKLLGVDMEALISAGRSLVEEKPRSLSALGELLSLRWPDRDSTSLGYAIRAFVPLVQLPPRGLWGRGGQAVCTSAEAWLGQPLNPRASLSEMILRYVAAFGPATVNDIQQWSGLTRLRTAVEVLRPQLVTFRDEEGRELFDLPNAPRPEAETKAPVRFLGEYDNVLLSHEDRSRIVSEEARKKLFTGNGLSSALLVDGFVSGSWKTLRQNERATLQIHLLRPVTKKDKEEIVEEAKKLLEKTDKEAKREVLFL